MICKNRPVATLCLLAAASIAGCQSPYRADQGALFGGLLGAGTGAIVGHQLGNTGAGAAIGAGVGALSGAVVGNELDKNEARNRALIAEQLGRQVAAGAVSQDDVVAMVKAGVNEELIINHIRAHGMNAPLQTSDLIVLQQQGVSTSIIKAMQEPPPQRPAQQVIVQESPPPVIVHEYAYGPPVWGYPHYYYRRPPYRPHGGVSWGMSFSN